MGVSSDKYAQELRTLAEREGYLTPWMVVEEAQPEESPLHAAFEWDDTKAGHEYRLNQARRLIRTVKIVYHQQEVREYTNVVVRKEPRYLPTVEVARYPDLRAQALMRLQRMRAEMENQLRALLQMAQEQADEQEQGHIVALNTALEALAVARVSLSSIH